MCMTFWLLLQVRWELLGLGSEHTPAHAVHVALRDACHGDVVLTGLGGSRSEVFMCQEPSQGLGRPSKKWAGLAKAVRTAPVVSHCSSPLPQADYE